MRIRQNKRRYRSVGQGQKAGFEEVGVTDDMSWAKQFRQLSMIVLPYTVRSFDSFSAQAASVDSFLQNVKRTWFAPMDGSS